MVWWILACIACFGLGCWVGQVRFALKIWPYLEEAHSAIQVMIDKEAQRGQD